MLGPNIRKLYYSAGEVAEIARIKPHVLTGWEVQFPQLRPTIRGGRKLYTPSDLDWILKVKVMKDQGQSNERIREAMSGSRPGESAEGGHRGQTEGTDLGSNRIAGIIRELKEILRMI